MVLRATEMKKKSSDPCVSGIRTIVQSKVDENLYEIFSLPNEMKVLLIHNEKFTKTSFAASVKVGHFDNPKEYPGLAHFLEHMLFMGTEDFPREHEFREFLGQHNGYSNAYNTNEFTLYYCDINSDHSKKLAEMFSSFFVCPLFSPDAVSRELSAVNSEYLNTLNLPGWRAGALLKEFMRNDVKEKLFLCGNDETLRKDGVLDKMREFYREMYSSNIMNLVICDPESIETLKSMAEQFNRILNKNRKIVILNQGNNFIKGENPENDARLSKTLNDVLTHKGYELFDEKFFSKIVQFASLDHKKSLHIYVVIPPMLPYFRTNAIAYIQFQLINSEPGRLLSKLKNEGLGFGIGLSNMPFDEYMRIGIKIELTEKGSKEITKVLNMTRDALAEIKADEGEYNRLKRLSQEDFDFQQNKSPISLAKSLARTLFYIPDENILNYKYIFEDYNPNLINFIVSSISDSSKWIINLADKNGTFDKKEKYYNVEYSVVGDYKYSGDAPEPEPLNAPHKDEFLENIEIIKGQERFYKSESFNNGKIHFVFDSDFNVPKSEIRIILRSNEVRKDYVALAIYSFILDDYLNEKFSRLLTNLHVSFKSEINFDRICLLFKGFSSKICYVAKLFMDELYNVPLDRFAVVREANVDLLSRVISSSPFMRMNDILASRLFSLPTFEQCLEQAKCIKAEEIKFLADFYTEIVAVGNIKYNEIVDLFDEVKCKHFISNNPTSQELPLSSIKVDFDSVSFETPYENNNLLACMYKINDPIDGINTSRAAYDFNTAVGRLIQNICHEDFFKELRTKEELGYVVYANFSRFDSAEFLNFVVQSGKSVEFLEERIGRFVSDLKESISAMTDELFETYKKSLISFYEEPILNLEDLGAFVISLCLKSNIDLEYKGKMIKIVKGLTKDDVVNSEILSRHIKLYSIKK